MSDSDIIEISDTIYVYEFDNDETGEREVGVNAGEGYDHGFGFLDAEQAKALIQFLEKAFAD